MPTELFLDTLEVLNAFDQIIVRTEQISSELRGRYLVFKAKVLLLLMFAVVKFIQERVKSFG